MTERLYRGQLIGGPDHGNFIDSTVPRVRSETVQRLWPNGVDGPVAEFTVTGWYVWDADTGMFGWDRWGK